MMAEMEGPGCIWRIWSALAAEGTREDLPRRQRRAGRRPAVRELLQRRHGPVQLPDALLRPGRARLPRARTSTSRSPTRSRARSWPSKGWGRYYQFVYTTFPEGTKVPTFSTELAAENADALAEGRRLLRRPAGHRSGGHARRARDRAATRSASPAGETGRAANSPGPGRSPSIRAKMRLRRPRGRDGRPAKARACRSPSTARRSRPSGARWAISSARPRA